MLLSRHQDTGQDHNIKIVNRCFENMAHFRYQNLVQEEIKGKLNSVNA
jgi:hypothetical protein